jgi:hypothetical protein
MPVKKMTYKFDAVVVFDSLLMIITPNHPIIIIRIGAKEFNLIFLGGA